MKILDRYVLVSFIKNYLISLMVLLGLYVVLDMVFNFDELAEAPGRAALVGTVRDVSTAGGKTRATITLIREENVPAGTEFKITDATGKGVGTMTVETTAGREVNGSVATTTPGAVRAGQSASAAAAGSSTIAVFGSIASYYFHQSFLFFVQLSGVIPVAAAAFTLIRMSRFNELTAILAAGVPLLRVSVPIVYCGVLLNLVLLPATQELVIPSMIPELTRKHDELQQTSAKAYPIRAMQDDNGSLLNAGRYTPPDGDKAPWMEVVDVIERRTMPVSAHISADFAVYDKANGSWILTNGVRRTGLRRDDPHSAPETITVWKTSISPDEIALNRSSDAMELLPTEKINELLQRQKSYGTLNLMRVKHFRWSQLLVNIVLLLLAIPCVLTREPGTMKTDIVKLVILTGLCMASIFVARQMAGTPPPGDNWRHQWPLIMAWVPIFIFLPLAIFLLDQKHTKKS